ncbi:ABC transporter permease [Methanolobus chelungpuianus]|uniref:ABC transporter permease n=1 Tax=Methanolobus chelungpuianus TaxID=502115 RepID=A0AAE3KW54_9EURY|nr:ABC transporter permease [Methanolobus chelungpuianus]MCQ6961957.1 ABC transporter permease [Methanolobus chelungpuianus]
MLSLKHSIRIALGSIGSAKMRSALTTLGIIIGIAAVIANVSLGASFSQYFTEEIGSVGNNFIIIQSKTSNLLHDNELELVKSTPGITGVSPISQQVAEVEYLSTTRQISVQGVNEDYEEVANIRMESGSFLTDKDKYVAVLGHDVAYEKFGRTISEKNTIQMTFVKANGETVTRNFKVKGIIASPETSFVQSGIESDVRIFIPISTMNEIMGEDYYWGFFAAAESMESISDVTDEVDRRLARNLGVPARDVDNEDAKPYSLMNQEEILEQVDQMSAALSSLLTAVALISLIVGSIGIMNIMLVTVTERTSEIGIMKSLGYKNREVLTMFIVESMVVGLIGGIFGTALGVLGAYVVVGAMGMPHVFPLNMIFVGVFVSIIVGLVAGVYPANKAAKMNPVDALRHE